jgi:hypothetical protein
MTTPLNFIQLKNKLSQLIERDTAANTGLTFLGDIINDAYMELCNSFHFDFLTKRSYIQSSAEYTTGTVAVSLASTTVTGTATTFTEDFIGRKINLQGQVYEISGYTDSTHITIGRPFEGSTAITADATSIFKDTYALPWDCDYTRIEKITNPYTQIALLMMPRERWLKRFPNPVDSGDAVHWIPSGYKQYRFPVSGTTTAQATTSTTSIVISSVSRALINDYYNDWVVVNTTRSLSSRVTDYVQSTQTFTNDPDITGQVSGDAVYFERNHPYLTLYPMPDDAQAFIIDYKVNPDKMVNDYDIPLIPPRFQEAIYLGAAKRSNLIMDDNRMRAVEDQFYKILSQMAKEYNADDDEDYQKQSVDNVEEISSMPFHLPLQGA